MSGFYYAVFNALPLFLRRRIYPLDFAVRDFVAAAVEEAPELVVDAGAGEARFRDLFSQSRYLALDSAVGDLQWDYSRLSAVAELEHVPFPSHRIDMVINTQVLEHVRDPRRVLCEFHRILRPGGSLILTAPQGWPEHQIPHDFFRFTRYALEAMLTEAGFTEVEIRRLGGYFHYLGHRLSYLPKILFSGRSGWLRVVLLPAELMSLGVFCFLAPLACYYLDPLDRTGEFTLGYSVRARKG